MFTNEFNGERTLKIDLYLAKLLTKNVVDLFRLTVYNKIYPGYTMYGNTTWCVSGITMVCGVPWYNTPCGNVVLLYPKK